MITDPVFYALAIPAVILLGLAKGGFSGIGTLGLPLIALAVSPVRAAAILLPILILQDAFGMWAYRRSVDRRILLRMLPGAVAGILSGYLLAAYVSDAVVALSVGVVAILFALRQLLWPHLVSRATGPMADRALATFWGGMTGFTSMIAHAGGPPFQIYTLPKGMSRDIYAGTTAVFFGLINWIKVPPYLALGQFNPESLTTAAILAPIAILSTLAGVRLVRRVPTDRFFRIILLLLLAVGAKLVYDGASRLIGG